MLKVSSESDTTLTSPSASPASRLHVALAVAVGCLMSLVLSGYQFGKSNHTVYLLDAFRQADPAILANDWFTNSTLQYHGLFSLLTRWCLSLGILQPVFLIGYLLTVVAFHYFAWRIVRAIGGEFTRPTTYLAAVVFLHLSAAGTGLGGFQFLQDGAFLPSNVSNVAVLAAIAMLLERRIWLAAVWTGVAGIFHINHAVVAPFVFAAGVLAQPGVLSDPRAAFRKYVGPALLAAVLVNINILPALLHLGQQTRTGPGMPLPEFIDLYARLRHPHHYYPASWPPAVFIASLWTVVTGALVLLKVGWRIDDAPRRALLAVSCLLLAAISLTLIFAGAIFVSERLVQMAIFRFTIHLMWLGCALTAWGIFEAGALGKWSPRWVAAAVITLLVGGYALAAGGLAGPTARDFLLGRSTPLLLTTLLTAAVLFAASARPRPRSRYRYPSPSACFGGLASVLVVCALGWGRWFGLNYIPEDSADYLRLATWAKANTPKDATFLVPPGEQSWRLAALRSIVINFKAIPQTSAEMPEWQRRMQHVTGQDNLMVFAGNFPSTLQQLDAAYAARTPDELLSTARHFGATYILTNHPLPENATNPLVEVQASGSFRLYKLGEVPLNPSDRPARSPL